MLPYKSKAKYFNKSQYTPFMCRANMARKHASFSFFDYGWSQWPQSVTGWESLTLP